MLQQCNGIHITRVPDITVITNLKNSSRFLLKVITPIGLLTQT